MPITRQDETELLTSLHEGVFEEPLWNSYLSRIRSRLQANYCSFFLHRKDAPATGSTELFCSRESLDVVRHHYVKDLYRIDSIPYEGLRPGRVYALSEVTAVASAAHNSFLRNELMPRGMSNMRMVRVKEPAGYSAWLSIWRGDDDFGAGDGALLAALAPHMAIALRNFAAMETLAAQAGRDGDPVPQFNSGRLSLDGKGRVVDLDVQAQRLLRRTTVFRRIKHGRLIPASQQASRALNEAVRNFALDHEARPCTVHLADDPWLDMLLVPVKARNPLDPATPVLNIHVHGDTESSAHRVEQLMQNFDLSRSEARMALNLARGRSIAETAEDMDLSIQTARFYSKRIYDKTGARGQTDLVRIVPASMITSG